MFSRFTLSEIKTEVRELLKLGIPLAIAELSGVLMSLIGTAMLGSTGAAAVAAVGIGRPVYLFAALIGIGGVILTAPLVAAATEKKDLVSVKRLLYIGGIVAIGLSAVLSGLLIFLIYNFHFLHQPPEVAALAVPFLWAMLPSLFPFLLYLHLVHFTDGLSLTKVGMVLSISALCLDILLNWVFIFGHLGAPCLGVVGVGVATCISQSLLVVAMAIYIYRHPIFAAIHSAEVDWTDKWTHLGEFCRLSLPVGFQIWIEFLAYAVAAALIGQLGKYPLAAHQIAIGLATSSFMLLLAIGSAASIRVGQAVGAQDGTRGARAGAVGLGVAICFVSVSAIAFFTFPAALVRLFVADPEVLKLAVPLLFIAAVFQFFDAVQCVSVALLRGMEDTTTPSIISIVAYWVVGMPIGYYLAFAKNWGLTGVWIGFLLALMIQAIWFSLRFFRKVKELNK